jgi:uncharacterized protein (TIGR02145 family)
LEFNTQYFWKIVAHDDQGNTTEGEVWNFTIEEEPVGFTCGDNFTDARDGQSYSTLKIGNQCWMAENLNIGNMVNYNSSDNEIIEKYCYDNNLSNCDTYGGLYQWNEAMQYTSDQSIKGICPEGWHLPSNSEWTTLTNYVRTQPENLCNSSTSNIAKSMSSTTNWNNSSNTCAVGNNPLLNNSTGFSCLPAGNHSSGSGGSYYLKKNCYFWTSTQSYSGYANNIYIFNSSSNVSSYSYEKQYGLSVRCIQN